MLYSRRLVRDHEAYLLASESGRKGGGNPSLRLPKRKKKSEARSQKPEATLDQKGAIIPPIKVANTVQDGDMAFFAELKNLYTWVDLDKELIKMRGWLLSNPGRKLTRRFAVKWLNRVDKPITNVLTRPPDNNGMGRSVE
jgi:hypothetical protein